jgi:outer membrane biosynthesis protein TonB
LDGIDTNTPGYKMLLSMGWSPSTNTLNPDSAAQRKPSTVVPIAKEGTLGLGATRATVASSVFARFGSQGLKFVSAGAKEEVLRRAKTEGGDFGGLLARLNKSATPTPTPAPPEEGSASVGERDSAAVSEADAAKEEKRKRKEAKREKKRKREQGEEEDGAEKKEEEEKTAVATTSGETSTASSRPAPQTTFKNPRMACVVFTLCFWIQACCSRTSSLHQVSSAPYRRKTYGRHLIGGHG